MVGFKKFIWIAVVLTLAGFACQETQATPISGLLSISGSAPGPGGSSGQLGFFGAAVDEGTNPSFNIMPDTPVAIASPSMFFDSSVVTSSLWSVGGFTLDLENPVHFGNKIFGSATIFSPEGQAVSGVDWTYTSLIGGTFTFKLTVGIPDSGTTMLLLGVGLIGLAGFRARFATS